MKPMYCNLCMRNVMPTKKVNWILFIILLVIGILPGILYAFYYLIKPKTLCPICGNDLYKSRADIGKPLWEKKKFF